VILYSPSDIEPPIADRRVRVGVLASGSGSNFEAIAEAVAIGRLPVEIPVLVCNNPGAFALERAASRNIEGVLLDHRAFGSRRAHDEAVVRALRERDVEWVVMAGWMRIATDALLDAYAGRILNIHPSLLPAFRGLHAVEQALEAGVKISGCTVHIVTASLDDGPIIAQAAVPVLEGDDAATLHARIHEAEHVLYPRAIGLALMRKTRD